MSHLGKERNLLLNQFPTLPQPNNQIYLGYVRYPNYYEPDYELRNIVIHPEDRRFIMTPRRLAADPQNVIWNHYRHGLNDPNDTRVREIILRGLEKHRRHRY